MFARGASGWLLALWGLVGASALVLALSLGTSGTNLGPAVLWAVLTAGLGAFAGFLSLFFRDPERSPAPGVVSSADGRVREVAREGDAWRISVFMNVTNVHVNRAPYPGTVASIESGGRHHHAAYADAATENVWRRYRFATDLGTVEVTQFTGAVARRLVSWVHPGSVVGKGERFGMIAFGSRVDVVLPASSATPVVAVGDHVRAGASSIARVT